jgi:hypothetical protein
MKNLNEKNYIVRVYESKPYGDYQFNDSIEFSDKPLTNIVEALDYARTTMIDQRNWRSTTNKMWASVKGNDLKDTLHLGEKELLNCNYIF